MVWDSGGGYNGLGNAPPVGKGAATHNGGSVKCGGGRKIKL